VIVSLTIGATYINLAAREQNKTIQSSSGHNKEPLKSSPQPQNIVHTDLVPFIYSWFMRATKSQDSLVGIATRLPKNRV
jgi:hypothetical protein